MSALSRTCGEHAWLYDAAFDGETGDEVEWLLGRFGAGAHSFREPGCGSARMFPGFICRGVAMTGIDRSPAMPARARERLAGDGLAAVLVEADMTDFHLSTSHDGALCPIGTLGYLITEEALAAHLDAVAEHLTPGAAYMVQIDVQDLADREVSGPDRHRRWEVEHDGGRIRTSHHGSNGGPTAGSSSRFRASTS